MPIIVKDIHLLQNSIFTIQYNTNLLLSIYWAEQLSELHTFDFILIGLIGFTTKKEGQYNKWINTITNAKYNYSSILRKSFKIFFLIAVNIKFNFDPHVQD